MNRRIVFNIEDDEQYFVLEDTYILAGVNGLDNEHYDKVNEFFKVSKYLSILMDQTTCIFSGEDIDHYESLRTDGKWVWSADINHYSINHCIEIPTVFLNHILEKKTGKVISDRKLARLTNWWFDNYEDLQSNFSSSKNVSIMK